MWFVCRMNKIWMQCLKIYSLFLRGFKPRIKARFTGPVVWTCISTELWCDFYQATGKIWCKELYEDTVYVIQLSNISIKNYFKQIKINVKQISRVELKVTNTVISYFQWGLCLCSYVFWVFFCALSCELLSFGFLSYTAHCIVRPSIYVSSNFPARTVHVYASFVFLKCRKLK